METEKERWMHKVVRLVKDVSVVRITDAFLRTKGTVVYPAGETCVIRHILADDLGDEGRFVAEMDDGERITMHREDFESMG